MSDESKKNIGLINAELPECIDNAIMNLTDKPTKSIGDTVSDIWFLVFGGVGQLAEKRKLKYAIELEKYNKELKEKVNQIPNERRIEPDIQIVAPALEASKYCVEKEELRKMFVNLIASSMDSDMVMGVHPIFTDIVSKLSSTDAMLFETIANNEYGDNCVIFGATVKSISFSLTVLEQLGLIVSKNNSENEPNDLKKNIINNDIRIYKSFVENFTIIDTAFDTLYNNIFNMLSNYLVNKRLSGTVLPRHKEVVDFFQKTISVTNLGERLKDICF